RDHGTEGSWHPAQEPRRTICAHATTEDRPGQTVGAMVSEIFTGHAIHWVTASAAPCLSIFKPLFIDSALPSLDPPLGLRPTDQFNDQMLWWSHERLHRRALRTDFEGFLEHIRVERD